MSNAILNGECNLVFYLESRQFPLTSTPFLTLSHGLASFWTIWTWTRVCWSWWWSWWCWCWGCLGGHDVHDVVGETDTTFIQIVFSEKLRTGQQQFILKKSTEGTNLSTKPTTPCSEIQVSKKLNVLLFLAIQTLLRFSSRSMVNGWLRTMTWQRFLSCLQSDSRPDCDVVCLSHITIITFWESFQHDDMMIKGAWSTGGQYRRNGQHGGNSQHGQCDQYGQHEFQFLIFYFMFLSATALTLLARGLEKLGLSKIT